MENKIDISVIIPMYNSAKYIEGAIASVLSQAEHGLNVEIIVVDDGSADNSREVVKNFKNDRIRLVESEKNNGSANARNTGIRLAKGEWIQFLDSDDKLGLDLYTKFELSRKPGINCYVFSAIFENHDNSIKRTITEVKDKRAIGYFYAVWNFFLKREICIPFKNEYRFEDVCFLFDMMLEKDLKIALIEDAYYIYNRKNEQSKMTNFNKKEYLKLYDYVYSRTVKGDALTKIFFLETFVGILFSKGIPLAISLPVATKTLLKFYRYLPAVIVNGIRNCVKNTRV